VLTRMNRCAARTSGENRHSRPTRPTSNLSGNKRRRRSSVILVVQVCGCDGSATLADVVAGVADREGLGACDGAERLAALWVTEHNDCDVLVQ
jgi:hypothetical protein